MAVSNNTRDKIRKHSLCSAILSIISDRLIRIDTSVINVSLRRDRKIIGRKPRYNVTGWWIDSEIDTEN